MKKYHSEDELNKAKKQWRKKYYDQHKDLCLARSRAVKKRKKALYDAIKAERGCLICGESNWKCLDFHHKNRTDKKAAVSELVRDDASHDVILVEIEKCVVMCANCHRKIHQTPYEKVVYKGWGYEIWLVNKAAYCGKLLGVKPGKKCSFHYHKIKDETFYVQKGKLYLRYGWGDTLEDCEEVIIVAGQVFYVPTGLRHQFEAIEDSLIVEFSTEHKDEDSIRIIKGD